MYEHYGKDNGGPMIDYEKIKIALKLCEKLDSPKLVCEFRISDGETCYLLYWFQLIPMDYTTYDIEKLLSKLTELTQPKPKYHIGQIVWAHGLEFDMDECVIDKPNQFGGYFVTFKDGGKSNFSEDRLYPDKKDLIESQIEYWINQLKDIEGFSELTGEYTLKTMSPTFEGKIKGFNHSEDKLEKVECDHETDGINYLNSTNEKDTDPARNYLDTLHLMCRLCGERYGYSECHHESDGICFTSGNYKCKKCGEFYR